MRTLALAAAFLVAVAARVVAQVPDPTPAPPFEMAPGVRYAAAVPTLEQVTGHAFGAEISSHQEVEAYLRALAAAAPDRCRLVEYGQSWQGRRLYYLVVARPQQIARLETIRAAMQRLADPRGLGDAEAERLLDGLPAVGWLANCVHGDEPSGTDAALYLLYHLCSRPWTTRSPRVCSTNASSSSTRCRTPTAATASCAVRAMRAAAGPMRRRSAPNTASRGRVAASTTRCST
jgi:hypothetical protein